MHSLQLLAVSYSFPPMAYPRSIQVARLLGALDASTLVICGSEDGTFTPYGKDETIASGVEGRMAGVIREPFFRSKLTRQIDELASRYTIPWSNLPDIHRSWVSRITKRFFKWQQTSGYEPDLVVTFGHPMSDHFFGAEYKRRKGAPWIAHFSDPWVDNPYNRQSGAADWINKRMERRVIGEADAIIFTSPETLDLVMKKYPASWRGKAHYLPHCYDEGAYDDALAPDDGRYVIRSIGTLYGNRSPEPLYEAIERIARENSSLLDGVSIEFAGYIHGGTEAVNTYPNAGRIVKFVGLVPHAEAIRLMKTANCLLVIDAPADLSVFFPSKLVEYLGAERFILALSPEGTTARIVKEAGGAVANPADVDQIVVSLKQVLEQRPERLPLPVKKYEKESVSEEFLRIAGSVINRSVRSRQWRPGLYEQKSPVGLDLEK
ncbi:MAG TPA: glycosyltransferase [Blastocatellia bacterium]|nr:glycosyltransferase [Blastocatellia bacterium]